MATLLQRVKSRLFVHSRRPARALLEGEWASVFHGRSLDYDDLRTYVVGDEVRDIDWKATARHGAPLVKRYVANRKQNVLFVVDTGRGMAAQTLSGETKSEIAVMACGLIGYLTVRHGDLVGMVRGNAAGTASTAMRSTEPALEQLLQAIAAETDLGGPQSALVKQLEYVVRHFQRRLILCVISDDLELGDRFEDLLRRLHVQHDILWITVEDADPTAIMASQETVDVADGYFLPTEVRRSKSVQAAYQRAITARRDRTEAVLLRQGVVHARIGSSDELMTAVFDLLERQRRAH